MNQKAHDELKALLELAEQARTENAAAARTIMDLEKAIRRVMRGAPGKVGNPEPLRESGPLTVSKPVAAQLAPDRPDDAMLEGVQCAGCGSTLQWRVNAVRGTWFAGCTRFPLCRGSMDRDTVWHKHVRWRERQAKRGLEPVDPTRGTETPNRDDLPDDEDLIPF